MFSCLREIAQRLGGEVVGADILCPGPGHSPQDRSLSIRPDPRSSGGLLVHSFAGEDPLAAKDYVRERLRLSRGGTQVCERTHVPRAPRTASERGDAERRDRALAIWRQACDPRGTPVELYLVRRGLALPDAAAGRAMRYHPACPFAGMRTPAMVCLVRDVVTNAPRAIHRTALDRDGRKIEVRGADRLTLGPVKGGAIKLTPDEDVTTCLGVGEGLESTLSLQSLPEFGPSPVWSLITAGGVKRLPVLPGLESLWIAVDHDANQTGQNAACTTASRWRQAGAEVFLITPVALDADVNDLLTGAQDA